MTGAYLEVLVPPSVRALPILYFFDAFEDGASVVIPPCLFQARDVPLRLPTQGQEGFGLGSDQQLVVNEGIEQRLDPIAISCRYKELRACIIDAQGELSAQFAEE